MESMERDPVLEGGPWANKGIQNNFEAETPPGQPSPSTQSNKHQHERCKPRFATTTVANRNRQAPFAHSVCWKTTQPSSARAKQLHQTAAPMAIATIAPSENQQKSSSSGTSGKKAHWSKLRLSSRMRLEKLDPGQRGNTSPLEKHQQDAEQKLVAQFAWDFR